MTSIQDMTDYQPITLFTNGLMEHKYLTDKFMKENGLTFRSEILNDPKLNEQYIRLFDECIDESWVNCVDRVGEFRVEFQRFTNGIFGDHGKFDSSSNVAKFYQNDQLLFEKKLSGNMLVLYGDGKTLEKTYYTSHQNGKIHIYNLKNKLIRETTIGFDAQKELRKVNDHYMISNTSEPCTHTNSLGFIDMRVFFDPTAHDVCTKPYDNSRIGLSTDYGLVPTVTTSDGFVIKNYDDYTQEYPILPYDQVSEFDFNQGNPKDVFAEGITALNFQNN